MIILGAIGYTMLGWVWCYWYVQRFFVRLAKEFPTQPHSIIGWGELPLFILSSLPLWPAVALAIALIDPFIEEPVGTKPKAVTRP